MVKNILFKGIHSILEVLENSVVIEIVRLNDEKVVGLIFALENVMDTVAIYVIKVVDISIEGLAY